MRALIAALAVIFLGLPAQAVPIAAGEHRSSLAVEFFNGSDEPAPCCVELSLSPIGSDIDIHASGAGDARGRLTVLQDSFVFEADARVPGPAGRAAVTASGTALATLTNTGPETIDDIGVNLFGEIGSGILDEMGAIGAAALVDDPARERALWRSVFTLSEPEDGPCFVAASTAGGCALAFDPVLLEAPPSAFFAPDFTLRPVGPLLSLDPGESRAFLLTAQARAEAVRIGEPAILSLLAAGLFGVIFLAQRRV